MGKEGKVVDLEGKGKSYGRIREGIGGSRKGRV